MINKFDFFRFLKYPKQEFNGTLKKDFNIFILIFILNILVLLTKYLITKEPIVEEDDLKFLTLSKLFSIVLLIPFVEELFFRGFLNFKKRYVLILSFISYIILCFSFIKHENLRNIIIVILFVFGILVLLKSTIYQFILRFIDNNLKFLNLYLLFSLQLYTLQIMKILTL